MSNDTDIARLERAVTQGLNIDLAEFDDPDQAAARAKGLEQDQQAAEKQAAKAEKDAAAAAEPAPATKGGGN